MSDLPALTPREDVLSFLATRRSRPAKTLQLPVPSDADLADLITLAARVPDHGKLEPWRFIVLKRDACLRLAAQAVARAEARDMDEAGIEKARLQFANAHLVVAVIASPKESAKIPDVEQTLSAGAACHQLVTAGLAAGWGANWLSSWLAFDREFLRDGLSLAGHEWAAGFIHLGTETNIPPERPRPDAAALTTWVDA